MQQLAQLLTPDMPGLPAGGNVSFVGGVVQYNPYHHHRRQDAGDKGGNPGAIQFQAGHAQLAIYKNPVEEKIDREGGQGQHHAGFGHLKGIAELLHAQKDDHGNERPCHDAEIGLCQEGHFGVLPHMCEQRAAGYAQQGDCQGDYRIKPYPVVQHPRSGYRILTAAGDGHQRRNSHGKPYAYNLRYANGIDGQ